MHVYCVHYALQKYGSHTMVDSIVAVQETVLVLRSHELRYLEAERQVDGP